MFLLWGLCQPSDTPRPYWWMPARRSDREKIKGEQCEICNIDERTRYECSVVVQTDFRYNAHLVLLDKCYCSYSINSCHFVIKIDIKPGMTRLDAPQINVYSARMH